MNNQVSISTHININVSDTYSNMNNNLNIILSPKLDQTFVVHHWLC